MPSQDQNRIKADEIATGPPDASDTMKWNDWRLRPVVLFAAAYTMIGILHEWAHALTAYLLGVPSTLFHLYVHLDQADGTLDERAVIRAAGPLACLIIGIACLFATRRAKGSRAELLLLYLAWFGVATFFGNLMSTPFVGDFSGIALAMDWPMPVRYGVALAGLLSLCGLSFYVGTELRRWTPVGVSAVKGMIGVIGLPAITGTAIALLIFLPMSSDFAVSRIGESAFWVFGGVGALISRKTPAEGKQDLGVGVADLALVIMAALIVRLMAGGIVLMP